ncbi:MAG: tRNA pseudouridine(55) synthase TruB [Eubacteriales bacterium]|nr:tRNA pseudouridine(55) synthase TruB [Eubacteriales bacterium]
MTQQPAKKLEKDGILLIEKPRDLTSFGVVSRLRRLIGERKIGHTGTLDPFAEGLLAVCVGQATRVVQFMDTYDKSYRVRILFGQATDTMDLTGTIIESRSFLPGELKALQDSDFQVIREAVAALVGPSMQMPPMYSAVKIDGQPLYKLAREGQTIDRQSRPITIYLADIDQIDCRPEHDQVEPYLALDLTLKVSKGTYIRVIADELGRHLGWFAHAISLERLTVGPFSRDHAISLDQLDLLFDQQLERNLAQNQVWQTLINQGLVYTMDDALADMPTLNVPMYLALRLAQGQNVVLHAGDLTTFAQTSFTPEFDLRLAVRCSVGLLGVIRLTLPSELTDLPVSPPYGYRLMPERIFLSHERLLPE